jgi:hypothetical protein
MEQRKQDAGTEYPHGRGYGHDYMRGGEVLGGYGYSERPEYEQPRGDVEPGETDREPDRRPDREARH